MKSILFLACVISLLGMTGCLVAEGGHHRHAHYERYHEVQVGAPTIIVPVHIGD